MIFDGKKFAAQIEEQLRLKVTSLTQKPKLVVILDPVNQGSVTYTNIKKKFAERIGVDFVIGDQTKIPQYNADKSVDGIIVQLPIEDSQKLIDQIDPNKDVDGLRGDSPFIAAAVKAVDEILNSNPPAGGQNLSKKILVVGAKGQVGQKLVQKFQCDGIDKDNFNPEKLKTADVVISATGQHSLIKEDMVKDGVVTIDLGFPTGDFDPEIANKASFFTPVPGGVGPVTVAMLFQNLLDSINGSSSATRTAQTSNS